MQFTFEKLEHNKVKFAFTVSAEKFEEAVQKAYLQNRSKISMPGFRKGKAPRSRIETMYGKSVFFEDALDILFPEVYEKALEESKVEPVSRPEIAVQKIGNGENLEFTVETYVYPEVTLGEYKGVEVTKYVHQASEDDVNQKLETEQKKQARTLTVTEGMVEPNDVLTFDYKGFVEGVAFEGGEAKEAVLKIGSGQFIPGFEDQLIGMELGKQGEIEVVFPTEYHAKDLAGKKAVFEVKLIQSERQELPELDDEFAQDVSEFNTLAEYKENIKKELQANFNQEAENRAKQQAFDIVVKNATFELPESMVETQMDRMLEGMDRNMKKQGFSLDQFLKMVGNDKADFREQYRAQAKQEVSSEVVLEALVKELNLEVTDEEVLAFIDKAFQGEKEEAEKFKSMMTDAQKENIRAQVKNVKSVDFVWDNAKVTTVEGDAPLAEEDTQEESK